MSQRLAKLRVEMTTIITAWEASGQGDGGVERSGDSVGFGDITGRPTGAYDSRSSFLGKSPPYIPYFGEILDRRDLLNTTVNRLNDGVCISDPSNVPSVVGGESRLEATMFVHW